MTSLSERLPPDYSEHEWEEIGEDGVGGNLYRLALPHGWLVQSVGSDEDYSSIAFVPNTFPDGRHVAWHQKPKPTYSPPEEGEGETPSMFA